ETAISRGSGGGRGRRFGCRSGWAAALVAGFALLLLRLRSRVPGRARKARDDIGDNGKEKDQRKIAAHTARDGGQGGRANGGEKRSYLRGEEVGGATGAFIVSLATLGSRRCRLAGLRLSVGMRTGADDGHRHETDHGKEHRHADVR